MKNRIILSVVIAALTIVAMSSCSRSYSDATINNAWNAPNTLVNSFNEYDLVVSEQSVCYTIDVSTPEGKTKLHKLSEKRANELALTEALMKYNCAMLINPQFTHLKKGKKILRVTVFGFPAYYRNTEKSSLHEQPGDNITINNNIEYNSSASKTTQQKRNKRRHRR